MASFLCLLLFTASALGAEVRWQAVAAREPIAPLSQLSSHQQYRDHLLAPGLFPQSVVKKALGVSWENILKNGVENCVYPICLSLLNAMIPALSDPIPDEHWVGSSRDRQKKIIKL